MEIQTDDYSKEIAQIITRLKPDWADLIEYKPNWKSEIHYVWIEFKNEIGESVSLATHGGECTVYWDECHTHLDHLQNSEADLMEASSFIDQIKSNKIILEQHYKGGKYSGGSFHKTEPDKIGRPGYKAVFKTWDHTRFEEIDRTSEKEPTIWETIKMNWKNRPK